MNINEDRVSINEGREINFDLLLVRMKALSDLHALLHWDVTDEVTLYAKTMTLVTECLKRDEDIMYVVGDIIALWYPSLHAAALSYSDCFDIDLVIEHALVDSGYPVQEEDDEEGWTDESESDNEQEVVDESGDTDNDVNEEDTDDEYNGVNK